VNSQLYPGRPAPDAVRWDSDLLVAYFCSEFAITEHLPIYSGGLGVLAGDHLKSASDLGLPMVAVGLAYHDGYFAQTFDDQGRQVAGPDRNLWSERPVERAEEVDGTPVTISVQIEGRAVRVEILQAWVGSTRLLLLDTDVAGNSEEDRGITGSLYGGDEETRIRQELILGLGGVRALRAMELPITVFHMNEGHSAFLVLERLREFTAAGSSFDEALAQVRASSVFTTHTPVPAGFDIFSEEQMERHLSWLAEEPGMALADWRALGGAPEDPESKQGFNMALLALRGAQHLNGVSQLHAQVSRGMWADLFPGRPTEEVPIIGITNGIHLPTWVGRGVQALMDRHLQAGWIWRAADHSAWEQVPNIPSTELFAARWACRRALIGLAAQHGFTLNPDALTLGFARRFATYKRATLLLRDRARLRALLQDPERPVQLVFAGKAHPRDFPGQDFLAEIVALSRDPEFAGHIAFIPGYDMAVGRTMVQGADVWLNTPRRPKEASGTSGMKVCVNGGLNLSVLDGWWVEGYEPGRGWPIGAGELYEDAERADTIEAEALYSVLEEQIIPLFYDRAPNGVPEGWVEHMRRSIAELTPRFSTHRMVREYGERLYLKALEASR
jgi:glycogen phosphorylase